MERRLTNVHSAKPQVRSLFDMLEAAGVNRAVISPGSRNAPLIIEAGARDWLEKHVVTDERSAAFTALGMAEATGSPVALICTSGTAVLNYHPAVAEAFYRQIPLVVISADRPGYRIDKGEGQTIRQQGVLANHTVAQIHIPEMSRPEETEKALARLLQTMIDLQGPVHINIAFEEPLYEQIPTHPPQHFSFRPAPSIPFDDTHLDRLEKTWKSAARKLILVTQGRFDPILSRQLERLAAFPDTVVLTETTANVHGQKLLPYIDRLIFPLDTERWKAFAPDLIVSVGNNIISKKIKYLLRERKPASGHWHIGHHYITPDTFDALTEHIRLSPCDFFSRLLFRIYDAEPQSDYAGLWHRMAAARERQHRLFLEQAPASDLVFYHLLSRHIPHGWHVHWANSTVIRYAQLMDFHPSVIHLGNRGTSGIDGSFSTAVGYARALPGRAKVLHVSGDLSAVYDSHAMWQEKPGNLKVMVLDNGGGDIFRFIPGPSGTRDYERYFTARSPIPPVEELARAYGWKAKRISLPASRKQTEQILLDFFAGPDDLLVVRTGDQNAHVLRDYFQSLG